MSQPPLAQPPMYQPTPKDPDTAFLIEMVGGFFGFLGLGYFYVGRSSDGLVRLLVWMIALAGAWILAWVFAAVIVGFCFMPVILAAQVGIPYWSADSLKRHMLANTTPPMG